MKIKSVFTILIFCCSISTGISQNDVKINSHYLFPEFTNGKVLLKTGIAQEMVLNYNSLTEEMIFETNGKKLAIANPELIDTVYILDRKFVQVEKIFYELLENLPVPLLVHHICRVIPPGKDSGYGGTSQTSAINSTSSLFTSSGIYELKLPEDYEVEPESEYVLKQDNKYLKVFNANKVISCFPEKKDAIKEFVKKNKTSFKKEEDVRELIRFCNK